MYDRLMHRFVLLLTRRYPFVLSADYVIMIVLVILSSLFKYLLNLLR